MKKRLIYLMPSLQDVPNTTRYQRVYWLSTEYELTVLLMYPSKIPEGLEGRAKIIMPPWGNHAAAKLLLPLWCAWHTRKTSAKAIVSCHLRSALLSGWFTKLLIGVPWIADIYDMPMLSDDFRKRSFISSMLWRNLIALMFRNCSKIFVTLAPGALDEYKIPSHKVEYFTNGTIINLNPGKDTIAFNKKRTTVLYVGWILRARGVDVILKAALSCKDCDIDWVLIGPSNESELVWISRYIKDNNLSKLRLLGELPHNQVIHWISEADICMCPFHDVYGTKYIYPIKIFEYLAQGKAVVATALPGVNLILEDRRNALLVPPNDCEAFASAVRTLANNSELRSALKKNALLDVENYSWKTIHMRFISSLDAVITYRALHTGR